MANFARSWGRMRSEGLRDFGRRVSADGWQFSTLCIVLYCMYIQYIQLLLHRPSTLSSWEIVSSLSYRPAGLWFFFFFLSFLFLSLWFGNQCACADYLDHGNRFVLVSLVDLRTRFSMSPWPCLRPRAARVSSSVEATRSLAVTSRWTWGLPWTGLHGSAHHFEKSCGVCGEW